jgi:uncharacterized protein YqeY
MSLVDELKKRVTLAMKARNVVEKEVLRVALGEIQVAEARSGEMSDEVASAIIKKLVKSNEETLELSSDEEQKRTLAQEIAVLQSLLPQVASVDEILGQLAEIRAELRAAKSDGQATGIAVKHLKSSSTNVNGKDVATAVQRIRA